MQTKVSFMSRHGSTKRSNTCEVHAMKRIAMLLVMVATMFLTGCASMATGGEQTVKLEVLDDAGGTTCTLDNWDGDYRARNGSTVKVGRSISDLKVSCKNDQQTGYVEVPSKVEWMWYVKDIFVMPLPAWGADTFTGNVFAYPKKISVMMDYRPEYKVSAK